MYIDFDGHHSGGSSYCKCKIFLLLHKLCLYNHRFKFSSEKEQVNKSQYIVSRPGLGSDPPFGSDRDRRRDTFHVSMLRKYIPDPSHVIREKSVQLKENLTYEETLVQIVDRKEQVLRSKVIPLVKVLWKNNEKEAATWEPEAQMRCQYPQLFS